MTRNRPVMFVLSAIGIAIATCLSAWAGSPTATTLSTLTGIARDLVGQTLSNAEVFVLSEASEVPGAFTRTDERGRFSIAGLPPSLYEVAGYKEGYFVALVRVNTVLSSSVDLLFRPVPRPGEPGSESIPGDRTWALRLPDRSILRDQSSAEALRPADPGASGNRLPAFLAQLDGRLDQSFGFGAAGVGANRDPGMQASETRLQLSSPLGERVDLDFTGGRARSDLGRAASPGGLATRAYSDLLVQVTYDPSDDSRVSLQSFFANRDLEAPRVATGGSRGLADRAWGWDARWSARLDASTHLDVGVDYRDASCATPAGPGGRAPDARALQASGKFESIAAKTHRLQLAFAAGRALPSAGIASGGFSSLYASDAGAPAWSVRLNAQDSWSLTGRTSLVYGVGYLGPLDERGATPIVLPRVGGVISRERISAHLVVSYLAGTSQNGAPPAQPIGYDARVELPLAGGFLLRGSASFAPALPDAGIATDDASRRPVYLTDGNAAVRAASVGIERATAFGRAFARYAIGDADGSLAVLPAARDPVHVLREERLSFRTGLGGVQFARTGTRVEASWRSVIRDDAPRPSGARARRSLETSVVQDLPHARETDLAWKLMLQYRSDRSSHADPATTAQLMEEPAFGREIRAGVSMAF